MLAEDAEDLAQAVRETLDSDACPLCVYRFSQDEAKAYEWKEYQEIYGEAEEL